MLKLHNIKNKNKDYYAESADAETPKCSQPTTEPCTQGTDVTDMTAKQPSEETHVQRETKTRSISRCTDRQWWAGKAAAKWFRGE